MPQYGFHFDSTRCIGCKTCELACKDYKQLDTAYAYRHIYDYEGGTWSRDEQGVCTPQDCFAYHVSISCQHCDDPACMKVCPTKAMHKDPDTGIVSVDTTRCVGCNYCHMACPYNAPVVDRQKGHSMKCDGCQERIAQGKRTICVDACPTRALDFAPIDELRKKYGDTPGIAPMPSPDYTHPNITITVCPAGRAPGDDVGFVANPEEVR